MVAPVPDTGQTYVRIALGDEACTPESEQPIYPAACGPFTLNLVQASRLMMPSARYGPLTVSHCFQDYPQVFGRYCRS